MTVDAASRASVTEREPCPPCPVVSVVIPSRHEAATIAGFVYRTLRALEGTPAEIIVVDDSDRDNTVAVLQRLREEFGELLVVLHRSQGSVPERTLGTAVVKGIRAARGEFVCVMDADGQHPPELIPTMLARAREIGADYVGGSRYTRGGSAEGLDGITRRGISVGLALVTRLAFLFTPIRSVTDPLSGFFLFRRAIVDRVELRPVGWKISLEVLVRGTARRVAEVPYTFARRADGDSKATISQGLLVLRHMLVLLLGLPGVRRFLTFGAVGASGVAVNTGTLLGLAALGFDALSWPIWVATEVAILWNYQLNRRITWRDRAAGSWWSYNLGAAGSSLAAIATTAALTTWAQAPLWLASIGGIALGTALNYVSADRLVFAHRRSGTERLAVAQRRRPRAPRTGRAVRIHPARRACHIGTAR